MLGRRAAGDLLTRVYVETRKSLELQSQGGARVKVKEVDLIDFAAEELGADVAFTATCRWNVTGSVGHWGHIHQRTNQYQAELTIQPVDGAWKVTKLEILQEERI